ncbi:hypothetical protein BS78_07G143000 [Paspalum vaginatum]|nr:hypothetical protein BS78_07G143000 [Paspalum vaginatum]
MSMARVSVNKLAVAGDAGPIESLSLAYVDSSCVDPLWDRACLGCPPQAGLCAAPSVQAPPLCSDWSVASVVEREAGALEKGLWGAASWDILGGIGRGGKGLGLVSKEREKYGR